MRLNLKRFLGLLILEALPAPIFADSVLNSPNELLRNTGTPGTEQHVIPRNLITIYQIKQNTYIIIGNKEWVNGQWIIELGD